MPAPYAFPNLAPGDYYLAWTDDSGQYHDAFSRGATSAPINPGGPRDRDRVRGTVAVDIALETIIWRQVTGTVTGPNDVPLDAASIDAYELMADGGLGDSVDRILTAPDGSFELALPDGDFVLLVSGHDPDTGDDYATARVEVSVAGDTTVPVVQLFPPAWYQVSGRVLLPTTCCRRLRGRTGPRRGRLRGDGRQGDDGQQRGATPSRPTRAPTGSKSADRRLRGDLGRGDRRPAEDLAAPDLTLATAGRLGGHRIRDGRRWPAARRRRGEPLPGLGRTRRLVGSELVATVTSESDGSYALTGVRADRTYTVRAAAFGHTPGSSARSRTWRQPHLRLDRRRRPGSDRAGQCQHPERHGRADLTALPPTWRSSSTAGTTTATATVRSSGPRRPPPT